MAVSSLFSSPGMILVWILVALILLYFARKPFRTSFKSVIRIPHNALRVWAASVLSAEKKVKDRNREVLINIGLDLTERKIEREFERMNAAILRDLQGYPALNRKLSELVAKLEEDYKASTEVPQELPDWAKMIEAVAKIEPTGDSLVANMLVEINRSMTRQHKIALDELRKNTSYRHTHLKKMLPLWRTLLSTLKDVGGAITSLTDRAKNVDRFMDEYENMVKSTDKAQRTLMSSSLTQFFTSGLVLLIAIGGIIINFNLIALPMSEMVGGSSYIGAFKTSDVAGLVIILMEVSIGLFLMESLRITNLFPVIHHMDDKLRIRILWVTLILLTTLAGVESALAFMRDRIAADMEALRQSLAGVEASRPAASVIPMAGQMVLGFILPFALTFVAIPLENFIASTRTVLGLFLEMVLRVFAFVLRLLGSLLKSIGRFVLSAYDLIIFPALWLEGVIKARKTLPTEDEAAPVAEPAPAPALEKKKPEKKAAAEPAKQPETTEEQGEKL